MAMLWGSGDFKIRKRNIGAPSYYLNGLEGGKKLFPVTIWPSAHKTEEHNMMQKFFHNAFGEISCFLLPDPGKVESSEEEGCYLKKYVLLLLELEKFVE